MSPKGLIVGTVMAIIAVMIGIMMFPSLIDSTDSIQYDSITQAANSATGVGETTEDVVLTDPLFEDNTANVTTITSDNGADSPVASSYTSSTDTLTVGGLAASATRVLSITFEADQLSGYTGLSDMVGIGPFIIFAALIIAGFASLYYSAKGSG